MLPPNMMSNQRMVQVSIPEALGESGVNLNAVVQELEGRMINEALRRSGDNKQGAARLFGLKRTTFAAKLRRCGVIALAASNGRKEY